jgi:hypothetical protein
VRGILRGIAGDTMAAQSLVLALALCGCKPTAAAPPPGLYPLPFDVAMDRLRHADIEGFRNARQCGLLIHFHPYETAGSAITWDVESSGQPMLSFTVRLAPAGADTQATIEVPPGHDGKGEEYDGNQAYDQPALMQPLRPAVQELIDAAMAQRAYDWHRITDLSSEGAPNNTQGICVSGKQILETEGQAGNVNDPGGMTHEQAEQWRDSERERVNAPPEDLTKPTLIPTPGAQ